MSCHHGMPSKVCIKRTGWLAPSVQCSVTNIPSMSLSLVLCYLLVTSIEACFQLPALPARSPPPRVPWPAPRVWPQGRPMCWPGRLWLAPGSSTAVRWSPELWHVIIWQYLDEACENYGNNGRRRRCRAWTYFPSRSHYSLIFGAFDKI